jgi:hypothetical protein
MAHEWQVWYFGIPEIVTVLGLVAILYLVQALRRR